VTGLSSAGFSLRILGLAKPKNAQAEAYATKGNSHKQLRSEKK